MTHARLAALVERTATPPVLIERAAGDAVSTPRYRFRSDVEVEQQPPLEYSVEGVLPRSGTAMLYGAPGVGKSLLALDYACHVATGAHWLGRATRRAAVGYVAAEGNAGMPQRLAAWKHRQGLTGVSIPVYFLPDAVNLLEAGDAAALALAIASVCVPLEVLIIDTLHRSMPGGEENSSRDFGIVSKHTETIRRALGPDNGGGLVLFVHHPAKGQDLERGTGSIRGSMDAMLFAKKDESGRRELRCEKAKDWPEFEPIPFDLVTVGDSCVIQVPNESAETAIGPKGPERACLVALGTSFLDDGASTTDWLEASGLPKSSFMRYRTALARAGYVTQTPRGRSMRYTLTDSGRYAIGLKSHLGPTEVPTSLAPQVPQVPPPFRVGTDGTELGTTSDERATQ